MQSAAAYLYVKRSAVFFLIVDGKMLYARAHALALYAAYERARKMRGQVRVLGIVLKVAAAQRAALYVDAGRKHQRHAARARFTAQQCARAVHKLPVKRARQKRRRGQRSRRQRLVYRVRALGLHPQPQRPVGYHRGRQVYAFYVLCAPHTLAREQGNFFAAL